MDYEKIIVEMLNRICLLEEQVKQLNESTSRAEVKMGTPEIKKYIFDLKVEAMNNGEKSLELVANNIHKALKLKNRMPMVCNAMRQAMNENDIILEQPASGYSSTLKIRYYLK